MMKGLAIPKYSFAAKQEAKRKEKNSQVSLTDFFQSFVKDIEDYEPTDYEKKVMGKKNE